MKNGIRKLFNPAKTKFFWAYFVLGFLLIVLGVMLMPIWGKAPEWVFWKDWGLRIINILIAACIIAYLALYLVKKVRRNTGVVQILTVIEFVVLAVIAAGCIMQQFKIISINGGACAILGLALWCRGTVEIFRAYYHQHGNNIYYPVWWLVIAILLVSLGVYMFVKPLFSDIQLLWAFVILVLIIGILLIVDGFIAKPKTIKKKTTKKQKEVEKDEEDEDEE